jgi:hypothetical protein
MLQGSHKSYSADPFKFFAQDAGNPGRVSLVLGRFCRTTFVTDQY